MKLYDFLNKCSLFLFISVISLIYFFGCKNSSSSEPVIFTADDEQSESFARQLRRDLNITIADDLEIDLWATEELLGDVIAIHVDDNGRILATVTERSNSSEFDIRPFDDWKTETLKWTTVEDRREFLRRELAPGRSELNTWLPDRNEDGLHDWRDLTVEKESVIRLEDTSGNGMADRAQLFIRGFNEEITDVAGGVLYHEGDVFLGVGPDVWRIMDTNGDGTGDVKESISHGYNVHIGHYGHGLSGFTVGPAGRIWWAIGDIGFNVTDKEGNRLAHPHEGAILRSEPDGSGFEVYATGLRNVHEFVFDKYGNLITVDNDGDFAGEDERLIYVIDGSDFGWRIYWQHGKYTDPTNNPYRVWMDEEYFMPRFDDQAAHLLPAIAPYITGPTGMAYNPGTALNENWKDHFFLVEFPGAPARAGIHAFTLTESGASFELEKSTLVMRGILPTGLDFGPDGALYVADWIEGWSQKDKGRIWRMDAPEGRNSAARIETRNLLSEDFTGRSSKSLQELMEHADMRVRQKVQFELVRRSDVESLYEVAGGDYPQLARIHGIWGIGQLGRRDIETVQPLIGLLDDADQEIRAQSAKMLGDVRYAPAVESLIPLLNDKSDRVRSFAAESLGRIGHTPAVEPIVKMLQENEDRDVYLRHMGAIALSRIGNANKIVALVDHPSRAVRIAAVIALQRLKHPGIANFLLDEDEFIVTNAARAVNDDEFIEEALPALAQVLNQNRFHNNEPLIRRAINANLFSGTQLDANRLASFSLKEDIPSEFRIEALNTLTVWPEPSVLDRVSGRYRGQIYNDREAAIDALAFVFQDLLLQENSDIKVAAIEAVSSLQYTTVLPDIYALLQHYTVSKVRIAALKALKDLGFDLIDEAVSMALADSSQSVRMAALGLLQELNLSIVTTVELLENVLNEGTTLEQQTAFETLGSLQGEPVNELMANQLGRLINGEQVPEVLLDVILAAENIDNQRLNNLLEEYQAQKAAEDLMVQFNETLEGGDRNRGQRIFYQNAAAQCIRCHVVNERGGDAGPDLTNIGSRLTREELLESLIDPMSRVTIDYSIVVATLKNGETVQGIIKQMTDSLVTIATGSGEITIERNEIAELDNTPSAMPAMGNVLNRSELRDLIEFLANLQD